MTPFGVQFGESTGVHHDPLRLLAGKSGLPKKNAKKTYIVPVFDDTTEEGFSPSHDTFRGSVRWKHWGTSWSPTASGWKERLTEEKCQEDVNFLKKGRKRGERWGQAAEPLFIIKIIRKKSYKKTFGEKSPDIQLSLSRLDGFLWHHHDRQRQGNATEHTET